MKIIEIKENVKIVQSDYDVILEKDDKVRVLKESLPKHPTDVELYVYLRENANKVEKIRVRSRGFVKSTVFRNPRITWDGGTIWVQEGGTILQIHVGFNDKFEIETVFNRDGSVKIIAIDHTYAIGVATYIEMK